MPVPRSWGPGPPAGPEGPAGPPAARRACWAALNRGNTLLSSGPAAHWASGGPGFPKARYTRGPADRAVFGQAIQARSGPCLYWPELQRGTQRSLSQIQPLHAKVASRQD